MYGHMDHHLSWSQLSLLQQLNCVCDTLAKQAVSNTIMKGYHNGLTQILPQEDVALIVWGDKITGDIFNSLCFHASKSVARKYHIHQWKKSKWTTKQFKEVNWEHLDHALKSKPDNYKVWQSKQTSGFCGTQVQVGLYSGEMYPDERCPNCGAGETVAHLMQCPEEDRTHLPNKNLAELEKWMETDGQIDPELIYWIPKYILMQNDRKFTQLSYMSKKICTLADSQDKIRWRHFTEGYISSHFYNIQWFHLSMSSNYLNGADWTKQFISMILQLTHSQWIYCNISLHNKCHGYLWNKQSESLLQTIAELSDLSPEEVPNNSRFLLEFNFTELTKAHLETQQYWTLAVNAALTARQDECQQGARIKRVRRKLNRKIPSWKKLGIIAVEHQIRLDGMHYHLNSTINDDITHPKQTTLTSLTAKRPHPSATLLTLKLNQRFRKPD